MSYVQKLNTATLWPNRKSKDSQPDYRGTVNVNGEEFEIALWNKRSSGGKEFLGGTIQKPRAQSPAPVQQDKTPPFDDEIPF